MTAPGALILLYHRVTTLASDPQLVAVTPKNFADHLDILRELGRPASLSDVVSRAANGDELAARIAVTFDDGYADNLLEAKPLLQATAVPATVFVATAGTANTQEFFWDALDRLLLQPGTLPRRLDVRVGNADYAFDLADAAHYAPDAWREHRHWNVTIPDAPTPRHQAYRDLCALIVKLHPSERRAALDRLHAWATVARATRPCAKTIGPDAPRPTHRMLTEQELITLSQDSLIDIGGHTATHPLLAAISPAAQYDEISAGKTALESILKRPVRAFAYPFGGRRDYTADTVAAVREAGFDYACSNFAGKVTAETDRFQLPRFLVRDWPADEFRARLTHWLTLSPNRPRATLAPAPEISCS